MKTSLALLFSLAFTGMVYAGASCCPVTAARAARAGQEAKPEVAAAAPQTSATVVAVAAPAQKPAQVAAADASTCDKAKSCGDKSKECGDNKKDCGTEAKCGAASCSVTATVVAPSNDG